MRNTSVSKSLTHSVFVRHDLQRIGRESENLVLEARLAFRHLPQLGLNIIPSLFGVERQRIGLCENEDKRLSVPAASKLRREAYPTL